MEWDLLEKTTFWIVDIDLSGADLNRVAEAAANALELSCEKVMVVDVRPGLVAFDILQRRIKAKTVIGKEKEILRRLGELPGVSLEPGAAVHSEGVLGFIALDPEEGERVLGESSRMAGDIVKAVSKRAMVFATGSEVIAGKIKDTNSPHIMAELENAGYKVKFGGILEDDAASAANSLESAMAEGYGLVITTGGVGAEDKDFSVEAILRLDPDAHTPWILKFEPDYHRHHKEGVRIAVGQSGLAYLVALPGPHEEAKLGCDRLISGLRGGMERVALAEHIAGALRERWRKTNRGGHGHGVQ